MFANARANIRDQKDAGTCLHEWAAKEIGDIHDKNRWYEFNPSLGFQLLEAGLLKDSKTMSPDTFAREHLGWWSGVVETINPISKARWAACETSSPPNSGVVCYGMKFAPDGSTCALAVCIKPANGAAHVECIDVQNLACGLTWLVDWLSARFDKGAQVVIDGQSNAQALVSRLNERHAPAGFIYVATTRTVIAASSIFVDAIKEKSVTHYGQASLTESALNSKKRKIGSDGGWGFGSTKTADSTLIEACSLAFWATQNTKRNPNKKQRVSF